MLTRVCVVLVCPTPPEGVLQSAVKLVAVTTGCVAVDPSGGPTAATVKKKTQQKHVNTGSFIFS